jgi:sialic acid synthase SpsE
MLKEGKMKTFVIAEAGANHDRKFNQALKLIDVAVEAGASAVKFQTYSSETLYAKNTPNFAGYKDINNLMSELELPREWQSDLKQYCDEKNIEFMSTPFDERAVDELYKLGVKRLKIAGFEATDPRIVRYAASTKLPLIITAAIGVDLVTIQKIIDWVVMENPNPEITFLHGNNAYPTPLYDVCLQQIQRIKQMKYSHKISVGISDHSVGTLVPPVAVALGASVVEKHYTLSRHLPGPDHGPHALEPEELKKMVSDIIDIEQTLYQRQTSISKSEQQFRNAMRSVVTTKPIMAGEVLTLDKITTKRPAVSNCIAADQYYDIVGKKLSKDIDADCVLTNEDFE